MEPTQQTITSNTAKSGGLKQLFPILALFVVAVVVLPAIFMPWAFFMGGSFHILPTWQGWGKMHSNTAGGDYVIRISIYPKTARHVGYTHVRGSAWLCTPRGESFYMNLSGDFQKDLRLNTDGKTASFSMYNYGIKSKFTADHRPRLALQGKWKNPDLVLDDQGSIARNFTADGSLYPPKSPARPNMAEVLPVTLHEGSNSDFETACKAVEKTR
jgi:hypothetical protein